MMKYGWGMEMYTKKEYLKSLENVNVLPILKEIDKGLREGKRFISLGRLDSDTFPYIKKKILAVLEQAGWKCECNVSTCRDDDGVAYVRVE